MYKSKMWSGFEVGIFSRAYYTRSLKVSLHWNLMDYWNLLNANPQTKILVLTANDIGKMAPCKCRWKKDSIVKTKA